MNQDKLKKFIIMSLLIVETVFIILSIKSFSNKTIDEVKNNNIVDKKLFSMFVETDNGYEEYLESNKFPEGYAINLEESKCLDAKGNIIDGILSGTGTNITVTSKTTSYCYLYFDKPEADIIINVTTNGTSGLPTINKYKAELTCNDSTSTYSNKYHRIEFSAVTSNGVNCNLNYINDSTAYTYLIDEVEEKTSNLGTVTRFDINNDATYTTLNNSDYDGNYTIFSSSSYSSSSGTTKTNAFSFDNGVFTSVPASLTTQTYYHILYTIPIGTNAANYQVCYTIPSKSSGSYSTSNAIYIFNDSNRVHYKYLSSTAQNDVCINLGVKSSEEKIKITQYAVSKIAPISFYIKKTEDITPIELKIGHRYTGKQPNNYVWFNNELWRIIGSIPTCMDSSCATQTNLVKIMRAESIGGLAYHSSQSNKLWGSGNTLYTLLNEYYYGKKDATGSSPCFGYSAYGYALCNYTNKGISSDSNDYYGRMIENVYMNIGNGDVIPNINELYIAETTALTSSSTKIGLISASDYGYATSDITYGSVGLSALSSYVQNNWMFGQGDEWTMTSSGSTEGYVRFVDRGSSGVGSSISTQTQNVVRPVVYLDSSVYIIKGTGEEINPYILGM